LLGEARSCDLFVNILFADLLSWETGMQSSIRSSRFAPALRSYAAATLLNLALVSTVLTPPDRPRAAQARIVTNTRRFRDTELIDCGAGEMGVLSVPYEQHAERTTIGAN
jgi:hypothetical protein